ncbi:MAG: S41 family peptidase [Chloroflexota bacterium]
MKLPQSSHRCRAAALFTTILLALILIGCNPTGLPNPATPTPPQLPSPTEIAALPLETPTTPATSAAPTALPTREPEPSKTAVPTSTAFLRSPPPASPTSGVEPTTEADSLSPTPTLLPKAERVSIFEDVWTTVKENYLYPDFHGADWQALHDKYLPLATAATTSDDFYQQISDMVDELGDDHSRYLSPSQAKEEDDLQSGNANYVGVGILSSPTDKALMVVFVFPGSPAEKAGLKRRDKIIAVDGQPFNDPRTDPSRIRGPKGSTVRLTVISPGEPQRDISIVRGTITGGIEPTVSRLSVEPTIGYLIIPDLWTDDMGARVAGDLKDLLDDGKPLNGLIVDLRGNGGGFRTVLEDILGEFVSGEVGKFFNQKEEHPFVIRKGDLNDRLKNVPVVVLVDKGSESYAEVLAGALQAKGRVKVVGVPSAGNTETIYRYDFDDQSRLWVAQESFKLPDGTNLEGRGVIPDVTIDKDWTEYSEKDDPHILAAIQLLTK